MLLQLGNFHQFDVNQGIMSLFFFLILPWISGRIVNHIKKESVSRGRQLVCAQSHCWNASSSLMVVHQYSKLCHFYIFKEKYVFRGHWIRWRDNLHQLSSHFAEQGLSLPLRQLMGWLALMWRSREDLWGVGQLHKTGTLPQCKLAGGKSAPTSPNPSGAALSQRGQESEQSAAGSKTAGRQTSLARVTLLAGQRFSGVSGHRVLNIEKNI